MNERRLPMIGLALVVLAIVGLLYQLELAVIVASTELVEPMTATVRNQQQAVQPTLLRWLLFVSGVLCLLAATTMISRYNLFVVRVPNSRFSPSMTAVLLGSLFIITWVVWF